MNQQAVPELAPQVARDIPPDAHDVVRNWIRPADDPNLLGQVWRRRST
jgi:hypothetical protein